jgi:hypothetical protein
MTENQIKRVTEDFCKMAKEEVRVENIGGVIYAFGSEVATLRLLKQYRHVPQARAEYSENLKTHYFVLELAPVSLEKLTGVA